METLALVALTIGLLAVIGAVVVAMREKDPAAAQSENGKQASSTAPQEQAVATSTAPPATPPAPGRKPKEVPHQEEEVVDLTPPAPRRKRSRRAPAGLPATQPAPDHVMTAPAERHPLAPLTMPGADPLFLGLGKQVQLLSDDLQRLRQQEEETERRLKLINGIAALLQDLEGSSPNGANKASSSLDK